jgi:ParB/RepB/Spo0J family partition protein
MSKFLKKPASDQNAKTLPDGQPARDHQALILPLSVIKSQQNIRHTVSEIDDLADSIKAHGLLQPLIVRKENGTFALIAGHRRFLALQKIGIREAPVRIQNVSEESVAILRLIENIQRKELSGFEEVSAVAKLLPMFDGNQSALARAIGKSQSYVNRCIRAADLAETYATSHSLTKSALFELADSERPDNVMAQAKSDSPTVRDVRESRKPSGPIAGGRYVRQAIQLRETSQAFSLRLNFHPERTPQETKEKMIETLENLLKRLRNS